MDCVCCLNGIPHTSIENTLNQRLPGGWGGGWDIMLSHHTRHHPAQKCIIIAVCFVLSFMFLISCLTTHHHHSPHKHTPPHLTNTAQWLYMFEHNLLWCAKKEMTFFKGYIALYLRNMDTHEKDPDHKVVQYISINSNMSNQPPYNLDSWSHDDVANMDSWLRSQKQRKLSVTYFLIEGTNC